MPWRSTEFWANLCHWAVTIVKELVTGAAALGALWVTIRAYYEKVMKPRRERTAMMKEILETVRRQELAMKAQTEQISEWVTLTQAMIESDPGYTVYRRADSDVFAASAGVTRLTGLDGNTMRNGGWRRAIHPEDLAKVERGWHEAKGPPPGIFICQYRLRHISPALGGATPVEETASPMFDKSGSFRGWASRIQLLSEPLMPNAAPRKTDENEVADNDDQ